MKLDVDFSALEAALKLLGAQKSTWSLGDIILEGSSAVLRELTAERNGPLMLHGRPVLIYIKDTNHDREKLENDPSSAQRFHVAECTTVEQMRNGGRYERYVITNDVSGSFKVTCVDSETYQTSETQARLKVCKNCLRRLNWHNCDGASDRHRDKVWQTFDLSDFLHSHNPKFRTLPLRLDFSPPDEYPPNWPAISTRIREAANWTCNKCCVRLSQHQELLDTHHKNGVKSDVNAKNLVALCKVCHAKQQYHSHYRVNEKDRRTIRRLRREQRPQ